MGKIELKLSESECVNFLQWALPHMQMRWQGFRKVHKQVCKRLKQRLFLLQLHNLDEYRHYLRKNSNEWSLLDAICQITISRFYRDKVMFDRLALEVLPKITKQACLQPNPRVRLWSAGCASGEEPYTLSLIWAFILARRFPGVQLQILATDTNAQLLQRADIGCYEFSSIKRLSIEWLQHAFEKNNNLYCLKQSFKQNAVFMQHDVRKPISAEPFDLILCRNLAFTYYTSELQQQVLDNLSNVLQPNGFLVIGAHEGFHDEQQQFVEYSKTLGIWQKIKG